MATASTLFDFATLRGIVDRFSGRKVLVLGDLMLDRYVWGRVERISPEAPVPIVEIEKETFSLGGAGNVAVNLRALGADPVLISVVGDAVEGKVLTRALAGRGVAPRRVVTHPAQPTTEKTRIIAQSPQVVPPYCESQ